MRKKKYKHTTEEKKKIASLGLKTSEVMPEAEFREKILRWSEANGIYIEIKTILDRYDRLMEKETDPATRTAIGTMGVAEIHKYINFSGGLTVNLKTIIEPDEDKKDDKIIILGNK